MKKTKSPVAEAASRPIKNTGPLSVLSAILRELMLELNLRELSVWEQYVSRFVNDPINGIPNAERGQRPAMNSARGNLRKELLTDKISFRVFCKGMRFLDFQSFEFKVIAHSKSGRVYEKSKLVVLATDESADEINDTTTPDQ